MSEIEDITEALELKIVKIIDKIVDAISKELGVDESDASINDNTTADADNTASTDIDTIDENANIDQTEADPPVTDEAGNAVTDPDAAR